MNIVVSVIVYGIRESAVLVKIVSASKKFPATSVMIIASMKTISALSVGNGIVLDGMLRVFPDMLVGKSAGIPLKVGGGKKADGSSFRPKNLTC